MTDESVLVVDDEAPVLEFCTEALVAAGYRARGVGHPREAIALAREQSFDIALLDIRLPDMDGMLLFEAIRQVQPGITGIVITGYASLDMAVDALSMGFSWFLRKPFSIDELLRAMDRTLEKVRLARENGRLRALVNLYEVAQTAARTREVGQIVELTLDAALKETRGDLASIAMFDDRTSHVAVRSCPDGAAVADPAGRADAERFMMSRVAQLGVGRLFGPGQPGSPALQDLMRATGIRAALAVPLVAQDEVLGALTVYKLGRANGHAFAEGDLQAVSLLSTHAAAAIRCARMGDDGASRPGRSVL